MPYLRMISSYSPDSCNGNVKEHRKVILDPQGESDEHQNVVTSRGSPLGHVYQVWSTSSTAFISYLADRPTHRHTHTRE